MGVEVLRITISAIKPGNEVEELAVFDDMPEIAAWWFCRLFPEDRADLMWGDEAYTEDKIPWFVGEITRKDIGDLVWDSFCVLSGGDGEKHIPAEGFKPDEEEEDGRYNDAYYNNLEVVRKKLVDIILYYLKERDTTGWKYRVKVKRGLD